MASPARDSYLATEVFTAPPQRLHLMLVEAAIRFVERARQCWQADQPQQATEAVIHAEEVVGEILAGLDRETGGDLVGKTAAVYLFIFRTLMEVNVQKDEGKLDGVLRVLEIQRQTWRQVCEQIGVAGPANRAGPDAISFHQAQPLPSPTSPPLPVDVPSAGQYSGRFSLEA